MCIVAPYEADAQLAYLEMQGITQFTITEDSDLLIYGCKKVFDILNCIHRVFPLKTLLFSYKNCNSSNVKISYIVRDLYVRIGASSSRISNMYIFNG